MRTATARCTACSTRLKRTSRVEDGKCSANRLVLAPVRSADPAVDVVVARLFPVTGLDGGRQLDPAEPLRALVAVHRGDVHPHRTTVVVGYRLTEHLQRDDYIAAPRLVKGQALGIRPIERAECDRC